MRILGREFTIPVWRIVIYCIAAVFSISYLAWLRFHKPDVVPGAVIQALPARQLADMPQVAIPIKKVIVYRDTEKATQELGIPKAAPQEKMQTAVDIPKLKYGGTAATFLNTSTGQSRTTIKANETPWFAFRNDLAIGAGAGVGTEGKTLAWRIRYDVAQMKNITVSPEFEGNYTEDRKEPFEGRAMLWLEWRR